MIRATPKMVESFWKTLLRGAAQTQGVSLPPIKRLKAGFSRMQLFCGDAEVTPIHPFKIEHRIGRMPRPSTKGSTSSIRRRSVRTAGR